MSVFLDRIMVEITADNAPLCDEYGDSIFDEAGNDIYLEQPGFVDVFPDVMTDPGIDFDYGIKGNNITDRVGGIGSMKFSLRNSTSNAAGLLGYYSPDHANFLGGFERETPLKLTLEKDGVRYVKWRGFTKNIEPVAGSHRERRVDVTGADVMILLDEFTKVGLQEIQLNAKPHELYAFLEEALQRRFPSTDFATNNNALTYGFDTATRKSSTARNEINKIALSVMDLVFVKGDTYEGGKLTSQTFAQRVTDQTNDFTFNDTMTDLETERTEVIDRAVVLTHPRTVGEEDEVLFSMSVTAGQAQSIYPGGSITFTAEYRDPNQEATRVAAYSVATQVASTDYKFGRGNGDGSEDMNTDATIAITEGATAAEVVITNNNATRTMHINAFQLQGRIIRQFQPIESVKEVANPMGDREIRMDLVYEDNAVSGEAIADLARVIYEDGFTQVQRVTYIANKSTTFMGYALTLEPGMRGNIVETVTGIDQNAFINGVSGRIFEGKLLEMSYLMDLAQPVSGELWLIGEAGNSEIGTTSHVFGV